MLAANAETFPKGKAKCERKPTNIRGRWHPGEPYGLARVPSAPNIGFLAMRERGGGKPIKKGHFLSRV